MTLNFIISLTLFLTFLNFTPTSALNLDGTYLLKLKYSILNDPNLALNSWDYLDQTPCSWNGVVCDTNFNVITLSLPNNQIVGTLPVDIGLMPHLQHIDLSNNLFNGTLPLSLFNASKLSVVSLSSNFISGGIPVISHSRLTVLNLSNNALGGSLPKNFSAVFDKMTVLSLKGNYFSGNVPGNFSGKLEVLDISSNVFNGSLPSDLGSGPSLRYMNFSYNKLSGDIPPNFVSGLLENATIDLSYNNLTGQIPGSKLLSGQKPDYFSGNPGLCGKPLKNLCVISSSPSNPPNSTVSISPAIAVIPRPDDSGSGSDMGSGSGPPNGHNGLKPATIVGITLADLAGVGILGAIFLYIYQVRKKKNENNNKNNINNNDNINNNKMGNFGGKKGVTMANDQIMVEVKDLSSNNKMHSKCLSKCLRGNESDGTTTTTTDSRNSSESEDGGTNGGNGGGSGGGGGGGELVMVDGETEMEVETLLKASAFILGASGSSIVYKAVLQNGSTFAVRRLGEIEFDKVKDFEGHVKGIAKVRHGNLVRVRGFYWASDEKLLISDYVSNGSLATSAYKKSGSTPHNLPLEVRLKIARGVARGLSYIHDKKLVHANIKPSNILLTPEMEPIISDLGLNWLVYGNNSCKGSGSARQFGSKRSIGSYDGTQDLSVSGSPYINPLGGSNGTGSPYQAPESLKNLKPSPKWDVYSFGIVLLELLTGKVYLDRELGQWTPSSAVEDRYWVLRIADVALRAEIQGKEEAMMAIFKLGFSCASLVPQKRPSMKDALQILEKISLSFV
ncbi:hypothetical protein RND81_11G163100 [Saponaria officinalis]|uniref:Protein kinase domain-containing protein n=1 Tax=Saponaria officinalis TaxID=3572 RepID=A0AAW1HND2_SAPOF